MSEVYAIVDIHISHKYFRGVSVDTRGHRCKQVSAAF